MGTIPEPYTPVNTESKDNKKTWDPSQDLRYLAYAARLKTLLVRTAGIVRNVRHAAVRPVI
jgi:hypothetical protein